MESSKIDLPPVPNKGGCDLSWLVNSPSGRGRLGYHGVRISSPPFLDLVKELILLC